MKTKGSLRRLPVLLGLALLFFAAGAPAEERTVNLRVQVKDKDGNPIPTAHVIIYQERFRGSTAIVRPPDLAEDTNTRGLATFAIKVPAGEELRLAIEVSAENFEGTKEDLEMGTNFPAQLLKQYFLEPKEKKKTDDLPPQSTTSLKVHVTRKDTGAGLQGATVRVLSLGGFTPLVVVGATDANGNVTVVTPINNEFEIQVRKDHFGERKQSVHTKEYLKEIGPYNFVLEREAGRQVTIHAADSENNRAVVEANVRLDGPGYHSATADGEGNAVLFVPEAGRFTVRITQQFYEDFRDQITIDAGEDPVRFDFALKPKPKNKDDGPNSISVTVYDNKGNALSDASVNAGPSTAPTDSGGSVTIRGDFDGNVPVTVSAPGFKKQTKTVRITGVGRFTGGAASVSFTMQPETSDDIINVTVTGAGAGKKKSGPLDGVTLSANGASATTGANGQGTLKGTFDGAVEVSATKEGYVTQTGTVNVSGGKASLSLTLQAEPESDSVIATVLAADPDGGSAKPLAGATVSVGSFTATTDGGGHATVTGAFDETTQVKAEAKGYLPQTQEVTIAKGTRAGTVSFTLKPESKLQLVVEVREATDAAPPIAGASVSIPGVPAVETKANGEAALDVKDSAITSQSAFTVKVHKDGYVDATSEVAANFLSPSKEARRWSVSLKRDWSALSKAIAELQGRVNALRAEARTQAAKAQSLKLLAAQSIAAIGRVRSWLAELKAAQKAFDAKLSGINCEEAKKLEQAIDEFARQAEEKEKAYLKLLEEAKGLAASCKSKADGAVVAEKHRQAIKTIGEMGALGSKANAEQQKLVRFADLIKSSGDVQARLKETVGQIENELATAKKDAGKASSDLIDGTTIKLNFPGRRAALEKELEALKAKFKLSKTYDELPSELRQKMESLDQTLAAGGADMSLTNPPEPDIGRLDDVIKPNLAEMEKSKTEADGIQAAFRKALCPAETKEQAIEKIRTMVTNAGFELGLAADLPAKAQACGALSPTPTATPQSTTTPTPPPTPTATPSATATPSPSPSPSPNDEMVTVPPVKGAGSIDYARTILNQAGFKSAFKAVKPKKKEDELTIADSAPAAGEKAKRGSVVTVYIYQKFEAETPTPTPARTIGMPSLIGLTIDQAVSQLPANMRINSVEAGDAPPSADLARTIFFQSPAPNSLVDASQPIVVTVHIYGSAQASVVERFDGFYVGSYKGDDKGAVRFTVTGGTITIQTPGSGSGQISASGSASFSGAGRTSNSSFTFDGRFSIDANGKATARGNWTGQQSGFRGSGTWSAARP